MKQVRISGTGSYVPPNVVTNKDLEKRMDTSDEWIRQRSGIEERRHVANGETPADLGLKAAENALHNAGLKAQDLDLIIAATLSPEHFFPGTSAFLQTKLGLETTPALDVRCQCSGFLYALTIARALISVGQYRRVLVVGAEVQSPVLDMTTRGRDIAVLFGDGAGAVILEATDDPQYGLFESELHAEGKYADKLWLPRPGTKDKDWINHDDIDAGDIFPRMEGRFVFKHAVVRLQEVVNSTLIKANLTTDAVDHFLFHQANLRINEHVAQTMQIPAHKLHNIQKYGNCSAGSIPILLDECVRSQKIKRGDTICLAAFGSGFTWGSIILRW